MKKENSMDFTNAWTRTQKVLGQLTPFFYLIFSTLHSPTTSPTPPSSGGAHTASTSA